MWLIEMIKKGERHTYLPKIPPQQKIFTAAI
jgi:hypothetical protein